MRLNLVVVRLPLQPFWVNNIVFVIVSLLMGNLIFNVVMLLAKNHFYKSEKSYIFRFCIIKH